MRGLLRGMGEDGSLKHVRQEKRLLIEKEEE